MTRLRREGGLLWLAAALTLLGGCRSRSRETLEKHHSALTFSEVMGFESNGAWTTTSGAVLALEAVRTEGASSLAVTPGSISNTSISSAAVSTTGKAKLALDIMLPVAQPNAGGWYGHLDVLVSCPSKSIYSAYIGSGELTGLPLGMWQTLVYEVPEPTRTALAAGCSDLTFQLGLGVPTPAGKFHLDNLRFVETVTRANCGALADGTVCTVGDVFGFENATWWLPTSGGPTIARVADHSQGSYSLEVAPAAGNGYSEVRTVRLNRLTQAGPTLAIDVKLPTEQPNPYWYGSVEIALNSPQAGISSSLGQAPLTGLPLASWQTLSFNVGTDILAKLLGTYDDLVVTVVLNVPPPTNGGKYYLDNIRFSSAGPGGCSGLPNGVACDDGSKCTQTDTCQSGQCIGGNAITCPTTVCHQPSTCNPATGLCAEGPALAENTPCDDGSVCTTGEKCHGGACDGGTTVNCGASTACKTQGSCIPSTGCPSPVFNEGASCDDGNLCSRTDTCSQGSCVGANWVTCSATACRGSGACNAATGVCSLGDAINEGNPCDDAEPCTTGERCQGGSCTGVTVDCGSSTECATQGSCVPTHGCPVPVPIRTGESCNDNDKCTTDDKCQAGACKGTQKTCAPKNACFTSGQCDSTTGECSDPRTPAQPGRTSKFDYDGAGRQIQDGDAELVFNALDELVEVKVKDTVSDPTQARLNSGKPVVRQKHTYGFDGLRTSTTVYDPVDSSKKQTQVWFSQHYTKRNGRREHYVTLGDRVLAKIVTVDPNAKSDGGAVASTTSARPTFSRGPKIAPEFVVFLVVLGSGLVFFVFVSLRNGRRRWVSVTTGFVGLTFVTASCDMFGFDSRSAAAWQPSETTFFHPGVAAGPELITDQYGGVLEERRYEPYGEPIDAWNGKPPAAPPVRQPVSFAVEPLNALNKLSDPSTGWSYHGARWMTTQTGRWLSPDPVIKTPEPKLISAPWALNPYQYASSNPALFWDPDGREDETIQRGDSSAKSSEKASASESGRQNPTASSQQAPAAAAKRGPTFGKDGPIPGSQRQKVEKAAKIVNGLLKDKEVVRVFSDTVAKLSNKPVNPNALADALAKMKMNVAESTRNLAARQQWLGDDAAKGKDPAFRAPPCYSSRDGNIYWRESRLAGGTIRQLAADILHEASHIAGAPNDDLAEFALDRIHNAAGLPR